MQERLREKRLDADSDIYASKGGKQPEAATFFEAKNYQKMETELDKMEHAQIKRFDVLMQDVQLTVVERVWVKMCIFMMVLACLPWIVWQYVRKPEEAHKLPFID